MTNPWKCGYVIHGWPFFSDRYVDMALVITLDQRQGSTEFNVINRFAEVGPALASIKVIYLGALTTVWVQLSKELDSFWQQDSVTIFLNISISTTFQLSETMLVIYGFHSEINKQWVQPYKGQ